MNARLSKLIHDAPLTIPQREYLESIIEDAPREMQLAWVALLRTMDESDLRTMGDVLMAQKDAHEGRISKEQMTTVQEELITSADDRAALVEELQKDTE